MAMAKAPREHRFPGLGSDLELSKLLRIEEAPHPDKDANGAAMLTSRKLLLSTDPSKAYLPGQPRVALPTASDDEDAVERFHRYLGEEHLTTKLDDMLPFAKYIFVQTPSFRHIMPLHHQKAHDRNVTVDEHPGLHLIWYYDRIFVKPIPAYFYCTAFWEYIEHAKPDVYMAAVGFMRSYYRLIKYPIDYELACEWHLIPKRPDDGQFPSYEDFCRFIAPFESVTDQFVPTRFRYGELRLSRINKTALISKGKLAYFHIHPQWGSVLSHLLAPIITIFAIFSVVLNSMQVTLNAKQLQPDGLPPPWNEFLAFSTWFPVVVMSLIAVTVGIAGFGVLYMGVRDFIWAKKVRHKKKNGDEHAGERSHGVVW